MVSDSSLHAYHGSVLGPLDRIVKLESGLNPGREGSNELDADRERDPL